MQQNSESTFLKNIQPLLILGRCFGTIFFVTSKSKFLPYTTYLFQLPMIICLLYWWFLSSKSILAISFVNSDNVIITSYTVFHICATYEVFSRYLIYFTQRHQFRRFLLEINTLHKALNIDQSKKIFARYKQILILVINLICVGGMNNFLLYKSSFQVAAERYWYYTIYLLYSVNETFLIKTVINELMGLFSKINANLHNTSNNNLSESIISLHHKLSRLVLDNNDILNTSFPGILLTMFIALTVGVVILASNAMICIHNGEVDSTFMVWNFWMVITMLTTIWFFIKMRVDLVKEVGALKYMYFIIYFITIMYL